MNPLRQMLAGRRDAPVEQPPSPMGPESVEVGSHHLRLGEQYCRSFAIVGYPREVSLGWLEPLASHAGRLEVSLHVEPLPAEVAADRLRRQMARLESSRSVEAAKGRLGDPSIDVAASDARELAAGLARGEQRLYKVGLYLTVHAASQEELESECARVRSVCASMLLQSQPLVWRSLQGWVTTLPFGVDAISQRRTFDTSALAASFPFTSAGLSCDSGVLYGLAVKGSGIVRWDRFAADNHNSVILARSGAGKSYLAKLEALRLLYQGVEVLVVDPEDEYTRLAEATGGARIALGAPGVRLNPFDLGSGPDAMVRRALFIHSLIALLLGGPLDPASKAALDNGIVAAYSRVGVSSDPRTHARPAPLLSDLAAELESQAGEVGKTLALRLAPFISGTHKGLFEGPTTTRPEGHLVVFSLRALPDELKAAGTMLTLDCIWRRVSDPTTRRRRLVVVDEAWLLMRDPEGARFLFRLAKAARKHWCGLSVVTQDAADLLGSELGMAVVANAATQILLRQAPQGASALAEAFGLSAGEKGFLLGAARGEGLLVAGERVAFRTVASAAEHALATSDPAEVAQDEPEP